MEAPDEVSLTNCLANASVPILSSILAERRPDAAFVNRDSRLAAAAKTVMTGGRRVSPSLSITIAQPSDVGKKDEHELRSKVNSWLENLG